MRGPIVSQPERSVAATASTWESSRRTSNAGIGSWAWAPAIATTDSTSGRRFPASAIRPTQLRAAPYCADTPAMQGRGVKLLGALAAAMSVLFGVGVLAAANVVDLPGSWRAKLGFQEETPNPPC